MALTLVAVKPLLSVTLKKISLKRFLEVTGDLSNHKRRYITAEDVNIGVSDIDHIYTETNNVTGVDIAHGGSGNPSPWTAQVCLEESRQVH